MEASKVTIEKAINEAREIKEKIGNCYVKVSKAEIEVLKNKNYATLPFKACEFGDSSLKSEDESKYVVLQANTVGPLDEAQYFSDGNIRMLFIDKESYIKEASFEEGDRGGHDQVKEYRESSLNNGEMTDNTTWNIMIDCTARCLYNAPFETISQEEKIKLFLKHACVVNLNSFPGVAMNNSTYSNKSELKKWLEKDGSFDLLKDQIETYKPTIIVGGHTFNMIFESRGLNWNPENIDADFEIFGYKIKKENVGEDCESSYYYYFNDEVTLINAYHPSYGNDDFTENVYKTYQTVKDRINSK